MFSNVPGSSMGAESWALSCCSRCFGTDVMVCSFHAMGYGVDGMIQILKLAISLHI